MGLRRFMVICFARPLDRAENLMLLASLSILGAASSIFVMYTLLVSTYLALPVSPAILEPTYYSGPLEKSIDPEAAWEDKYFGLKTALEDLFASRLVSSSWLVLLFYSVIVAIALYPVISKIRLQLPLILYRAGMTPGRVYFYSIAVALFYSLPLLAALVSSLVLATLWASLDPLRILVSRGFASILASCVSLSVIFQSSYLASGRVDVSLFSSVVSAASFYLVLLVTGFSPVPVVLGLAAVVSWLGVRVSLRRWSY
ncbi:MAG: hypothetical protein F7C07_06615 [Desulfurococcales archaeon]|nr:hypothetical protein [Desulfurococcales archaeon]